MNNKSKVRIIQDDQNSGYIDDGFEQSAITKFFSKYHYQVDEIKNKTKLQDLRNLVAVQLQKRETFYKREADVILERTGRVYKNDLNENKKGESLDLNNHLLDAAKNYENHCEKIKNQEGLSESIKEKLLQKASDNFIQLVSQIESEYLNHNELP